jgi:hypothetical protein
MGYYIIFILYLYYIDLDIGYNGVLAGPFGELDFEFIMDLYACICSNRQAANPVHICIFLQHEVVYFKNDTLRTRSVPVEILGSLEI